MQSALAKQVAELTSREKAELLRSLERDLEGIARGVEQHPGVCGGDACIAATRIPIWLLEQMRRLGVSEADILYSYPTLRAEDLVNAWAYVNVNSAEIDRAIAEQEAEESE